MTNQYYQIYYGDELIETKVIPIYSPRVEVLGGDIGFSNTKRRFSVCFFDQLSDKGYISLKKKRKINSLNIYFQKTKNNKLLTKTMKELKLKLFILIAIKISPLRFFCLFSHFFYSFSFFNSILLSLFFFFFR